MDVMKHDAVSAVRPDHAIGMIGVAALIAMPAKTRTSIASHDLIKSKPRAVHPCCTLL